MTTATNVMVWDESELDRHGDEIHIWYVALADDDGEPVSVTIKTWSEKAAWVTAGGLANEYGLPVERF